MENKLLYIFVLAIFSMGFFYLGRYMHEPAPELKIEESVPETVSVKIDESETARLTIDGSELKIVINTSLFNRNFIFLDSKTDNIVTTLSVGNPVIESPYYSVVRGHTHDWLVVTRIEASGTGFMQHVDEWYILGWSGNMKMVLSYQSQGFNVPYDGDKNTYWKTDIINESYSGDSAVDIKFTKKDCFTTEDGEDKDCSESSHLVHYVWDDNRVEFVLE